MSYHLISYYCPVTHSTQLCGPAVPLACRYALAHSLVTAYSLWQELCSPLHAYVSLPHGFQVFAQMPFCPTYIALLFVLEVRVY